MASGFEVYVESEVYNAGRDDDGQEFHAESFFAVIEFPSGRRFAHTRKFRGCEVGYDAEEGRTWFADTRPKARATVQRLVDRVAAAGTFDKQYWREVPAAYGSEAYQKGGWGQAQIEREYEFDMRGY